MTQFRLDSVEDHVVEQWLAANTTVPLIFCGELDQLIFLTIDM